MSSEFNLLSLHYAIDIHPRTWICLNGKGLEKVFLILEKEVIKKNEISLNKLINIISSRYNCTPNTIGRVIYRRSTYYPIPILIEMLYLCGNSKFFETELNNYTQYLKVNSASAKPVRAIKCLNNNISKIIGAFMADGSLSVQVVFAEKDENKLKSITTELDKTNFSYSYGIVPSRNQYYVSIQINQGNKEIVSELIKKNSKTLKIQTHYSIELSEKYKDNITAVKRWIYQEFNVKCNYTKSHNGAWRVSYSNKIIARFLERYFEVVPGPKSLTAFEPNIIKLSSLPLRKSFARGILMFDGCVTKLNKLTFTTISKALFESIKEIWEKDDIEFGYSTYNRRDKVEFILFTTSNNKECKLIEYFEENTQKQKLIRWLNGSVSKNPKINLTTNSRISLDKLLKVLREIQKCDSNYISIFFGCSHTSTRIYLKILKNRGKINLTTNPKGISEYVDSKSKVLLRIDYHNKLFQKIKDEFREYESFGKIIGIKKGTLSAWKVRRSRIPLYILKEFSEILKLEYSEILENVIEVDREIVELI